MLYVDRDEAEDIIKEAIDDYLPDETLQQILNIIYGDEFLIVDKKFLEQHFDDDE